jgi:hypothetical protein
MCYTNCITEALFLEVHDVFDLVHKAAQFYVSVNVLCVWPLVRREDGSLPVSANYRISLKRFKLLGRVNLNNAVLIVCERKNIYPSPHQPLPSVG